jgi:hypothetical protein
MILSEELKIRLGLGVSKYANDWWLNKTLMRRDDKNQAPWTCHRRNRIFVKIEASIEVKASAFLACCVAFGKLLTFLNLSCHRYNMG